MVGANAVVIANNAKSLDSAGGWLIFIVAGISVAFVMMLIFIDWYVERSMQPQRTVRAEMGEPRAVIANPNWPVKIEDAQVGDVVTGGNGKPWRVRCKHGGTLGLVPVGLWHRFYWWCRGC